MSPPKTVVMIEMLFGMWTGVGSRNYIRGIQIPTGIFEGMTLRFSCTLLSTIPSGHDVVIYLHAVNQHSDGWMQKQSSRACLDQVLIAIRSFTLRCDHNRSNPRLIAIMNLIAKLGIIYATACHASLCTAALDCLSVSVHCRHTQPFLLYTHTAWGGGGGD